MDEVAGVCTSEIIDLILLHQPTQGVKNKAQGPKSARPARPTDSFRKCLDL